MNPSIPATTQESFEVSRRVLTGMIRIVDRIIAGALGHPAAPAGLSESFKRRPETQRVLPAMLQALGSSSNTLVRLSDGPGLQSRDCFSVCRSIVELAVNVCYILAEGEGAATVQAWQPLRRDQAVDFQALNDEPLTAGAGPKHVIRVEEEGQWGKRIRVELGAERRIVAEGVGLIFSDRKPWGCRPIHCAFR